MACAASTPAIPPDFERIAAEPLIGTTIEWCDNSFGQSYDLPLPYSWPTEAGTEPAPKTSGAG